MDTLAEILANIANGVKNAVQQFYEHIKYMQQNNIEIPPGTPGVTQGGNLIYSDGGAQPSVVDLISITAKAVKRVLCLNSLLLDMNAIVTPKLVNDLRNSPGLVITATVTTVAAISLAEFIAILIAAGFVGFTLAEAIKMFDEWLNSGATREAAEEIAGAFSNAQENEDTDSNATTSQNEKNPAPSTKKPSLKQLKEALKRAHQNANDKWHIDRPDHKWGSVGIRNQNSPNGWQQICKVIEQVMATGTVVDNYLHPNGAYVFVVEGTYNGIIIQIQYSYVNGVWYISTAFPMVR